MGWLDLRQLRLSLGGPGGEGAAHQIAASCVCLCWQSALSASAPLPSTSVLLDQFHQDFLSFSNMNLWFAVQGCLCALAVSFPCLSCWEPITSCLPAWASSCELAEGQKHL